MLKDFDKFMSQLKETNQTLDFFCDFDKISENVEDIKLSLCMLNSLIGASDLRKSVETIWNRDKNAFSVMDILIAVRTIIASIQMDMHIVTFMPMDVLHKLMTITPMR